MTTQGEWVRRLSADYQSNHEHVASLVRPLDPDRLLRRPGPGRWSTGEVLEHLMLMDQLFLRAIEPLVATARIDAGATGREWKASFVGQKIADALRAPKPLRSSKRAVPRTPHAGAAEAFLAGDLRFAQLLNDAARLDWNAVRLRPPVLPWFPLKLNLGDVFQIHAVHVARHTKQIERTLDETREFDHAKPRRR